MVEYPEVRKEMEAKGYQMSDEEYENHIRYARRKANMAGRGERYVPLLLPDVIRENAIRTAINSVTMGLMMLDMA